MDGFEEMIYERAATEVASKQMRPGLYAKAFSDARGDEKAAIALYIKMRADQLKKELHEQLDARRRQEAERTRRQEREPSSAALREEGPRYFVAISDKPDFAGPLSVAEIRDRLRNGEFSPQSPIVRAEGQSYRSLRQQVGQFRIANLIR